MAWEIVIVVLGIIFCLMGWNLWKKRKEIMENYHMYVNMAPAPKKKKK